MRKEYDFDKLKGRRNPYAKKLKKQITIRVGVDVLEYFKQLSDETGIPYQNLINMYLRDCVVSGKRPFIQVGIATRFLKSVQLRVPAGARHSRHYRITPGGTCP